MYCEDSAAAHIDHFCPRLVDPLMTFVWENYLLACSVCNSNFKRDEFPTGADGEAQLLDPTSDDPSEHLTFSPSTGKYRGLPGSAKGCESIRVFGLNRSVLERSRKDAWRLYEIGIVGYDRALAEGDEEKAEGIQGVLVRLPFAGVLQALLSVASGAYAGLLDPQCLDAVRRRPEIASWQG